MLANKPLSHYEGEQKGAAAWCRRLGFFGFLFFLLKGLAWIFALLILPYFGLID